MQFRFAVLALVLALLSGIAAASIADGRPVDDVMDSALLETDEELSAAQNVDNTVESSDSDVTNDDLEVSDEGVDPADVDETREATDEDLQEFGNQLKTFANPKWHWLQHKWNWLTAHLTGQQMKAEHTVHHITHYQKLLAKYLKRREELKTVPDTRLQRKYEILTARHHHLMNILAGIKDRKAAMDSLKKKHSKLLNLYKELQKRYASLDGEKYVNIRTKMGDIKVQVNRKIKHWKSACMRTINAANAMRKSQEAMKAAYENVRKHLAVELRREREARKEHHDGLNAAKRREVRRWLRKMIRRKEKDVNIVVAEKADIKFKSDTQAAKAQLAKDKVAARSKKAPGAKLMQELKAKIAEERARMNAAKQAAKDAERKHKDAARKTQQALDAAKAHAAAKKAQALDAEKEVVRLGPVQREAAKAAKAAQTKVKDLRAALRAQKDANQKKIAAQLAKEVVSAQAAAREAAAAADKIRAQRKAAAARQNQLRAEAATARAQALKDHAAVIKADKIAAAKQAAKDNKAAIAKARRLRDAALAADGRRRARLAARAKAALAAAHRAALQARRNADALKARLAAARRAAAHAARIARLRWLAQRKAALKAHAARVERARLVEARRAQALQNREDARIRAVRARLAAEARRRANTSCRRCFSRCPAHMRQTNAAHMWIRHVRFGRCQRFQFRRANRRYCSNWKVRRTCNRTCGKCPRWANKYNAWARRMRFLKNQARWKAQVARRRR